MNVLVIPEDFRKDQYILRPVVKALLASQGKPRANVRVLTDPLLGGIERATDLSVLRDEILVRYRGMIDLFLLIVDRDAKTGRRESLLGLEQALRAALPAGKCFLAESAWEEIEVWALAGADLPAAWPWVDVRTHPHPKEAYFDVVATRRKLMDEPGAGRATLGVEAAARLDRVRQLCPEVAHLESRISDYVGQGRCEGAPFNG